MILVSLPLHSLAHSELSTVFYEKVLILAWGWVIIYLSISIISFSSLSSYLIMNYVSVVVVSQIWQLDHQVRGSRSVCLRNCFHTTDDGDTQRFPTRSASSLGRISEQVLPWRWLQVQTFLLCIISRRGRLDRIIIIIISIRPSITATNYYQWGFQVHQQKWIFQTRYEGHKAYKEGIQLTFFSSFILYL